MKLGLYRKPIINVQGFKSKGTTNRGMYVKILICSIKCGKIFRPFVIHSSGQPCFLSTQQLSFAPEELSTLQVLISSNNHLSVLFRPLVSSVKN